MSERLSLTVCDWDDSALIKAYEKGMSLQFQKEFSKKDNAAKETRKKSSRKKLEWKVGDNCRAIYSGDNAWYEAKIIAIDGDMCTVDFLGYHEEAEVELSALDQSLGKREVKKQKKNAKNSLNMSDVIEEAPSGDETKHDYTIQSPHYVHPRREREHHHRRNTETHMFDQSNYTAAENTFHSAYPMVRYPEMPPNIIPTALPPCVDMKNSSLNAMMTAWYMAGYYTALHHGQKNQSQHCCCHQAHCHQ